MHTRPGLARLLAQPGRCRPADAGRMGLAGGRQRRPAALSGADAADRRRAHELCLRARPCDPRRGSRCRAEASGPLPMRAKANWLACTDKVCVPEQGEVSLDLPVGGAADAGPALRRMAPCPAAAAGQRRRISRSSGDRLEIAVPLPASVDASASPISSPPTTARSIMPRRRRSAATAIRWSPSLKRRRGEPAALSRRARARRRARPRDSARCPGAVPAGGAAGRRAWARRGPARGARRAGRAGCCST